MEHWELVAPLKFLFSRTLMALLLRVVITPGIQNVMSGTLSAKHKLDFITKGLSAQVYFSFESNNYQHTTRLQSFDSFGIKARMLLVKLFINT